jgi:hypothetical protein
MDYMKNAKPGEADAGTLRFIRCDKDGRELSQKELEAMNFSNSTIDALVTETAQRLGAEPGPDGGFSDGITTG